MLSAELREEKDSFNLVEFNWSQVLPQIETKVALLAFTRIGIFRRDMWLIDRFGPLIRHSVVDSP